MAKNKKSFIIYTDWRETFNALPDEKAGQLIKHIFAYVNDENPKTDDVLINAVFANIKQTLKRDLRKYETIREKRVIAGKASADKRQQVLTSVDTSEQVCPVNDSVNVNDSDNDKERYIIPPSIFLIAKYCKKRNNGIDAQYFYDWYQTRGWKVGKDKMKDWQSAIRTWERRNKKPEPKQMMP
jgi:hypothetical protein